MLFYSLKKTPPAILKHALESFDLNLAKTIKDWSVIKQKKILTYMKKQTYKA